MLFLFLITCCRPTIFPTLFEIPLLELLENASGLAVAIGVVFI